MFNDNNVFKFEQLVQPKINKITHKLNSNTQLPTCAVFCYLSEFNKIFNIHILIKL